MGTYSREYFNSQLAHFTLYFVYLAIGEFVTIYICTVGYVPASNLSLQNPYNS